MTTSPSPILRAGLFLGVGLGGFLDGIVFHQILQVHGMLSARVAKTSIANLEINMFWDGVFHACTWVMTLIGVILLFRAGSSGGPLASGGRFSGALMVGWGIFNLVEGSLNHHLLHLHHVVEAKGESIFDLFFLISGGLLVFAGWWLLSAERRPRRT